MSGQHRRHSRHGIVRPGEPDDRRSRDVAGLSRYDVHLASIPLVLLVAWAIALVTSVPTHAAFAAAALTLLPLIVDGLAVNPPG